MEQLTRKTIDAATHHRALILNVNQNSTYKKRSLVDSILQSEGPLMPPPKLETPVEVSITRFLYSKDLRKKIFELNNIKLAGKISKDVVIIGIGSEGTTQAYAFANDNGSENYMSICDTEEHVCNNLHEELKDLNGKECLLFTGMTYKGKNTVNYVEKIKNAGGKPIGTMTTFDFQTISGREYISKKLGSEFKIFSTISLWDCISFLDDREEAKPLIQWANQYAVKQAVSQ